MHIQTQVFCKAVEALENLFFVGIQEAYDISVQLLMRELNVTLQTTIKKEREQGNAKISAQKKELKANSALMQRYKDLNSIDYELYRLGNMTMNNLMRLVFCINIFDVYIYECRGNEVLPDCEEVSGFAR